MTHKIERSRASLSGKTWSGRLHTLHGSWSRPFGVMARPPTQRVDGSASKLDTDRASNEEGERRGAT